MVAARQVWTGGVQAGPYVASTVGRRLEQFLQSVVARSGELPVAPLPGQSVTHVPQLMLLGPCGPVCSRLEGSWQVLARVVYRIGGRPSCVSSWTSRTCRTATNPSWWVVVGV